MSNGLKLYTSNRMELLVDACAEIAAAPLASALSAEIMVVPNRGMERWLSMQLSNRLGVWANARFLLPNAFVEQLFNRVFTEFPDEPLLEPGLVAWRIMTILSGPIQTDDHYAQLSSYLGDKRPLRRFQLATKIADAFDQYTLYRPDMVLAWEDGVEDHWQAKLWRTLNEQLKGRHRARLWRSFFNVAYKLTKEMLPERIIAFGHSSLPPYHTAILSAIASVIPVHLFVLNPCLEYWDDIISQREAVRIQRAELKRKPNRPFSADLHLDQGNALLAALGGYGRDFLAGLHELEGEAIALPYDPEPATLLAAVQSDILHLRERGAAAEAPRTAVNKADRSIQIHSCHSPLREVEVLYDHLLDWFNRQPSLNPSDILVMTPDIEAYAPFIKAVFDTPEERADKIPYSLTDLTLKSESPLAETFLALLSLPHSRFGASAVMALLETSEIRAAFDIDEQELALASTWVRSCGVRWGVSADSQTSRDLPATPENTWEAGLERLLLGYALPSGGDRLFSSIAPFGGIEGMDALLAGKIVDFVTTLSEFSAAACRERTLKEWSELLLSLLGSFFSVDNDKAEELAGIRSLLFSLRAPETLGLYGEMVDLEIVLDHLGGELKKSGAHAPFLSGGVTFCAMMPMRSIPFKVLCCIGMNDTAFPRRSYHASWDLIAAKPRRGDRSLEREDRYLFLEALLSAREQMYISYVGQSVRDNTACRPSVVVEELLGYLDKGFYPCAAPPPAGNANADPGALRNTIVVNHHLQAWSPAYFGDNDRLFSFSAANAAGAVSVSQGAKSPQSVDFCPKPLTPLSITAPLEVDIDALIRFFKNPVRFFLNKRLGIILEDAESAIEETEPFSVEGLDKYRIAHDLIGRFLGEGTTAESYQLLKAKGQLPHGNVGKYAFDALSGEVRAFTDELQPFIAAEAPLAPFIVDKRIDAFHLHGVIGNIFPSAHLAYRFANIAPVDYLSLWIPHLALCAFAPEQYPKVSLLIGKDAMFRIKPVDNALDILHNLLKGREEGMRGPLHFFPKSSYAYAEKVRKMRDAQEQPDPDEALASALAQWNGNDYARAERDDHYYALCFNATVPLDEDFARLALAIWEPIFDHLEKVEA
jgi:exodeoxyribonuclease V gamma subunit